MGPTQGVGAVNAGRDFFGQEFLKGSLVWSLGVRRLQGLNFFARCRAENAHVLGHVGICGVQPKLIKLVRRGAFGVQPNVSGFGLAELGAVGFFDQGCGERVGLAAVHASDQFRAGGDVAPLVRPPHLQLHAVVLPQIVKVVALNELVTEFREADAGFLARFHGVLGQHVVDGDVLAHVADEVQEAKIFEPFVVVHDLGSVGPAEFQKLFQLRALTAEVVLQGVKIQQLTLVGFERRIAHHSGGTAHQSNGLVAGALEVH